MNLAIAVTEFAASRPKRELFALVCLPIIGVLIAFPPGYFENSNVLIGLALFPFALFFSGSGRINFLFLFITLSFVVIACVFPLKVFYFAAALFYALLVLELYVGRINPLILFLGGVTLPIFHQVATIMGFPIRLLLSEWAGNLLKLVNFHVEVLGNTMLRNGVEFTVDEACMGLNMVSFSMLMAIAVIAHNYRTMRLRLTFQQLLIFFLSVMTLIIIANLFRIIILVIFNIPPDDPMHEIIGLACVVFYIVVPLYFIVTWMLRTFGSDPSSQREALSTVTSPGIRSKYFVGTIGVALLVVGIVHPTLRDNDKMRRQTVSMKNFETQQLEDGITKLSNDELLVYVKPIPDFYSGEHTPLICWKGSGYKITRVTRRVISGTPVYTGVLSKEGIDLQTSWWYFDGKTRTIEQVEWRTLMLKGGAGFSLVNVTAQDEQTLLRNLAWILKPGGLVLKQHPGTSGR